MKQTREFIKKNKKVLLAIFAAALMFSSVYGLIGDYHPAVSSNPSGHHIVPALINVNETASVSIGVNYFTQTSVANSTTTTVP